MRIKIDDAQSLRRFGIRLRRAREDAEISVPALAATLGLSVTTIRRRELGKKLPNMTGMMAHATAVGAELSIVVNID